MTSKMILIALFSALLIGTVVAEDTTAVSGASTTTTAATSTTTASIAPQKWTARNGSVACVVMTAVKLELLVNSTTHSLLQDKTEVKKTEDTTAESSCSSTEDMLVIKHNAVTLALTFTPTLSGSAKSFSLTNITATFGGETFNNAAISDLKAPIAQIYRCKAERHITINNANSNGTQSSVTLILAGIRVQALRNDNTTDLGSEGDFICVEDGTWASNVVPIAVGCGLAGLIIIVLIAYMIGRRRAYNHVRE